MPRSLGAPWSRRRSRRAPLRPVLANAQQGRAGAGRALFPSHSCPTFVPPPRAPSGTPLANSWPTPKAGAGRWRIALPWLRRTFFAPYYHRTFAVLPRGLRARVATGLGTPACDRVWRWSSPRPSGRAAEQPSFSAPLLTNLCPTPGDWPSRLRPTARGVCRTPTPSLLSPHHGADGRGREAVPHLRGAARPSACRRGVLLGGASRRSVAAAAAPRWAARRPLRDHRRPDGRVRPGAAR
jgi:hypothetical protein